MKKKNKEVVELVITYKTEYIKGLRTKTEIKDINKWIKNVVFISINDSCRFIEFNGGRESTTNTKINVKYKEKFTYKDEIRDGHIYIKKIPNK